jgi:hypothetical protein
MVGYVGVLSFSYYGSRLGIKQDCISKNNENKKS